MKIGTALLSLVLSVASGAGIAQTAEELRNNNNTDNVMSFGMGPDLKMWSPLNQINKSNVRRLVPV